MTGQTQIVSIALHRSESAWRQDYHEKDETSPVTHGKNSMSMLEYSILYRLNSRHRLQVGG